MKTPTDWFGPAWGAPINAMLPEVETPVDRTCGFCHKPIAFGESGFVIADRTSTPEPCHRDCYFVSQGLDPQFK